MNTIEKIGKVEAIALFITIVNNTIIINLPSNLLDASGTGSWINLIYITIIVSFFTLLTCKFFKPFINSDILDVSEFLGHKWLKIIIGLLYIIFFMLMSALYLRYFTNSLQILYYIDTPLVFLLLLLLIPVVITSRYGLKSISGVNLIFVPITLIAIITLFFTASKDFVWQRLFPVFGYGIKETFVNQLTNVAAFNVIAYIFFLKPFFKDEDSFKKVSLISVIICGIYLILSVISLLMTFSFITQTDENLSLHLLTRLVSFGNFIQRIDAIFVFIWILSALSLLSLNLFLIAHIFKKICNLKYETELVYPFSSLLLAFCLLFKNITVVKFSFRKIYSIYNIILVFVISFIIMFIGYRKNKE